MIEGRNRGAALAFGAHEVEAIHEIACDATPDDFPPS
jgi:hypothetical protein